jgi:hypothetical protein
MSSLRAVNASLLPKRKTARRIRQAQRGTLPSAAERPRIEVKVSPTIPADKLNDPRLDKLLEASETFFNCNRQCCFNDKYRLLLCLHEAGHTVYARAVGSKVEFHGPTIYWDARPQYDCPAISRSSVSYTIPADAPVNAVIKTHIGGFVFRSELSSSPNDEISIGMDTDGCRQWYQERVGGTEDDFIKAIEEARQEIINDLRSPKFRHEVWATAREFEGGVFGAGANRN